MAVPEEERERFCRVLHDSRMSLYRLARRIYKFN